MSGSSLMSGLRITAVVMYHLTEIVCEIHLSFGEFLDSLSKNLRFELGVLFPNGGGRRSRSVDYSIQHFLRLRHILVDQRV